MEIVNAVKSICRDGNHIILWDFDGVDYDNVFKSLKEVQINYRLPTIHIIKSINGFNAFCLAKYPFEMVYEIKSNTRYNDYYHNVFGYNLGGWCLRMGIDKRYLDCISSDVIILGSMAHRVFFSHWFNIEFEGLFDNSDELRLNKYIRSSYENKQ